VVRTYWLVQVFNEASWNLDLQPDRTDDQVESSFGPVAELARKAEDWGFTGLLLADSQNLNADIWVELGIAGAATSRLRLSPDVDLPRRRRRRGRRARSDGRTPEGRRRERPPCRCRLRRHEER
jgi:Luciferase-like monooxygenase